MLKRFLNNEDGATAIEYGLIAALIGVAIILAVTAVGDGLNATFNEVAGELGYLNDYVMSAPLLGWRAQSVLVSPPRNAAPSERRFCLLRVP